MKQSKRILDHEDEIFDYEPYEERKHKIKRVDSQHHHRREIRNWKKVWSEHEDDFDEMDEFFGKK